MKNLMFSVMLLTDANSSCRNSVSRWWCGAPLKSSSIPDRSLWHVRVVYTTRQWQRKKIYETLNKIHFRHWGPFYLPYHTLVAEWQRHTYSFLLDTKSLLHRRKWKSWPAVEGDHWPWHRSSGGCPLCRLETTGQLLHPAAGSNQVGCSCTWQRSLFRKTNTGATEEISALNQSWRCCNHPTSNRPCKGHQVPYLVPRTVDCLSPLLSNTDHSPYAPGACSVTGM